MARSTGAGNGSADDISIIGPRMKVVGNLSSEGTVRIEGHIEGDVQAAKAVVLGEGGEIHGDVHTQDAVISGRIRGTLTAASRLELQAAARVDGEVHARRLQLEEGAMLNGTVRMGEVGQESVSRKGAEADRRASAPPVADASPGEAARAEPS